MSDVKRLSCLGRGDGVNAKRGYPGISCTSTKIAITSVWYLFFTGPEQSPENIHGCS
jgi:hypothetical protein